MHSATARSMQGHSRQTWQRQQTQRSKQRQVSRQRLHSTTRARKRMMAMLAKGDRSARTRRARQGANRRTRRAPRVARAWTSCGLPVGSAHGPLPAGRFVTSARAQRFPRVARTRQAAALPLWPVSGLATNRVRLPARLVAQWHWIDFAPPSWRCASLTVAGAAQVGSVLADLAPSFPFNRARRAERASTKVRQV